VDTPIAGGNRTGAQDKLKEIDAEFGGLAAPHSVELDAMLTQTAP
jgi:hypothetical protein